MRYRAMTLDDVAAGHALSRASGWNQRADDWTLLLAKNPGRFVAAVTDDGHIVGTAGAACYGSALAWVCMVLVDASARGQGIGTRLMEAVLERLDDMALVGLDATPQGRPVYARLGFAEDRTFLRLGAEHTEAMAPDASVRRLERRDLDEVLALDRDVFGADRSEVLRWALDRAPAWRAREGDALAGYCFGRNGEHSRHVGPVVARGADVARRLLTAAAGGDGRVIVDVAADRADAKMALEALGFREQRPLIRMYRAGGRAPGRPDLQVAIFGPEFG